MRFAVPLRHPLRLALATVVLAGVVGFHQTPPSTAASQVSSQGLTYQKPPQVIVGLVDAPQPPEIRIDPQRKWMLLMEPVGLPSIAELAEPELRIAGLRIHPRNNAQSRPRRVFAAMALKRLSDGREVTFHGLPAGSLRIRHVSWSPDGRHLAFALVRDTAVELWIAEPDTGGARRVSDARLNEAFRGPPFFWLSDSETLLCRLVPDERGPAPEPPQVPVGPVVRENLGKTAPARTYQDLLKSPYDEALFEYYWTSRIALVGLDGRVTPIGEKGLYRQAKPSPNGKYLLVESTHRPFSYLVPHYRFPNRVEVWDREGRLVHLVADIALAEEVPISFDAVAPGPRSLGWRADAPATLYWVEAADGGDPRKPAEVRDRLYMLPAPFTGDPTTLVALGLRFTEVAWGNGHLALISERWRKNRKLRTWMVRPDSPSEEPVVLFDRSYEDRYSDPGRPVLHATPWGTSVLVSPDDGRTIFLAGEGASPEGNRPFLDRWDLISRQVKRLWRSEAPYYEVPLELLDEEGKLLVTRRESKTEPPNYFRRDLPSHRIEPLSDFAHPAPQLAGVKKQLIRYQRDDGVELSATLYLPAGYSPADGPLPMLMWAYPREYKTAAAAAQVRDSPYRFYRLRPATHLVFLALGYAILDGPTMPIIGEGDKEPNDTYVEQLVSSAKAAVDEVVRRGVADRDRIAIGGHSYGAFMTANLLAHSDLFRAGIARSGAYNRTLTPFGFQAEQRTFWQAPEVYFKMSPFMHADKVNEPLLLIHGMADNNSGTFPIQSRRMYHALKGHGAVARLVLLPRESHGYRARESILHVYWEMNRWLEEYVKNAPPRTSSND